MPNSFQDVAIMLPPVYRPYSFTFSLDPDIVRHSKIFAILMEWLSQLDFLITNVY
jgi:hypothetical protein